MKGQLIDLTRSLNGGWRLTIEVSQDVRGLFDKLKDAPVALDLKKWRKPRSKDANAYMWTLLDKLADALHRDREGLYADYIRQYGIYKDFALTEEEAKTFRHMWESTGTGWPTDRLDFTPDGERLVIRAYYGSSTYNTKQMSRVIDAIVTDCKELGIETLPPDELRRMGVI